MIQFEKPMNPNASEDFRKAIEEASRNLNKRFTDLGEKFKFDDAPKDIHVDPDESYCGVMRLESRTLWEDSVKVLLGNGYKVTMRLEDDGNHIVIEYNEAK